MRPEDEAKIEAQLPLVKLYARRMCSRGADFDDCFEEGMMALWKAWESFDPSYGTPFGAWAAFKIHKRIASLIRRRAKQGAARTVVSLSSDAIDQDWDSGIRGELVGDRDCDEEERQKRRREEIAHCLRHLPERDAAIVRAFYLEDLSSDEVGLRFGLSANRIRHICSHALRRIRHAEAGRER